MRPGHLWKLSDRARRKLEREITYEYTEGVISCSSWDGRDSAYNKSCSGSSPVKVLFENGNKKIIVEEYFYQILWTDEIKMEHFGYLIRRHVWKIPNIAHHKKTRHLNVVVAALCCGVLKRLAKSKINATNIGISCRIICNSFKEHLFPFETYQHILHAVFSVKGASTKYWL